MPAVAQSPDSPSRSIAQLYRSRQLISTLTARDLNARYRGSVLGYFWSLANPLLLLAVYTIVFTKFFPRPDVQPYWLFLFTGILPWTFFAGALLESTSVLSSNGGLIKKVTFQAEVLPIVIVVSHMVHLLLALPILLAAVGVGVIFFDVPFGWPVLLAPVILVLLALFVAGVTLAVSATAVLFRDLRDIVANLLNLGFFLTPIIYSLDSFFVSRAGGLALRINPMTTFVVAFQDVFFFSRIPSNLDIVLMLAWSIGAVWLGLIVFERLRDTLAEAI